jgi:hypothetical protein
MAATADGSRTVNLASSYINFSKFSIPHNRKILSIVYKKDLLINLKKHNEKRNAKKEMYLPKDNRGRRLYLTKIEGGSFSKSL